MCKVCDKSDFLIDSIKKLCPIEEMAAIIKEQLKDVEDAPKFTPRAIELAFLVSIACRWAVQLHIHPRALLDEMEAAALHAYSRLISIEDLKKVIAALGLEAEILEVDEENQKEKKLKDYES